MSKPREKHAPLPITLAEWKELRRLAGEETKSVSQYLRDKLNAQFASEGLTLRLSTPSRFLLADDAGGEAER